MIFYVIIKVVNGLSPLIIIYFINQNELRRNLLERLLRKY